MHSFSHHPVTNMQSVPEQRPRNPDLMESVNFAKLPKKTKLPEKIELQEKRKQEKLPAPSANPHS